jgi:hypothetical protein
MKKLFKLVPIALFGFCLVFNSCSEESKEEISTNSKSIVELSPAFLGQLHNRGLDHVMYNYNDPQAETNLPEDNASKVADFLFSFSTEELCSNRECKLDQYLSLNELMLPEQGVFYATQRSNTNFDVNNIDTTYLHNIEESAEIIKSSGLLDYEHKILLDELIIKLRANFDGTLSVNELLNFCMVNRENLYINYDTENNGDKIMLTLLEISVNSLEWWETFDERNTVARPKVAPWIAMDIAGGIVGAGVAIARSDRNKPVKGEDVLEGALWGAVIASTGIVGRLARWTKLW